MTRARTGLVLALLGLALLGLATGCEDTAPSPTSGDAGDLPDVPGPLDADVLLDAPDTVDATDLRDTNDLPATNDLLDASDASDALDAVPPDLLAELLPFADADTVGGVHPCRDGAAWPLRVESERLPLVVHHRRGEGREAEAVLGFAETAWRVEVEELGFRAPLPDGGRCGPDERFDIFLWRGIEVSYVDVLAPNPTTPWDDWFAYMVVDPWGPYGGERLGVTVAHELNHACQAADDWFDSPMIFEATATFVEDLVFDEVDDYHGVLGDFQARPHWSLDRDDRYRTWFMYGASLYLHFLHERYYSTDPAFVGRLWRGLRNPPGPNEPDFEDALDTMLRADHGVSFADSVSEHAVWRWYTGARDDGRHFEEGAAFPPTALVPATTIAVDGGEVVVEPAPALLGSVYLELTGVPGAQVEAQLYLAVAPEVRWVAVALPLAAADEGAPTVLDAASPVGIVLDADGRRVLVVTALPAQADDDPDTRSRATYGVRVEARSTTTE